MVILALQFTEQHADHLGRIKPSVHFREGEVGLGDPELAVPPVRNLTPAGPTPPAATRERIAWAAAAVLLVALVALSLVRFQEASADKTVRRFSFTPDNLYNVAWASGAHGWAAVSPNGKHIAYLSGGDELVITGA